MNLYAPGALKSSIVSGGARANVMRERRKERIVMDKVTAVNILLANAYCCTLSLHCDDCPLFEENNLKRCREYTNEQHLFEAVRVVENAMKGVER